MLRGIDRSHVGSVVIQIPEYEIPEGWGCTEDLWGIPDVAEVRITIVIIVPNW